MPKIDELTQLLEDLKVARADRDESKEAMDKRLQELKSDDVYSFQADKNLNAKRLVEELESQIKVMGKEFYIENPSNKKIAPGLEVKMFKTYIIRNASEALKWAKKNFMAGLRFKTDKVDDIKLLVFKHAPDLLELDWDKVMDYAKKFSDVPGIEVEDAPQVQIASKLP